jgi:hypothetical protein
MMEVLIKNRIIVLAIFFILLSIAIVSSYKELQVAYLVSAYICHIFFFLFFLTESFGKISQKRHIAWRIIARIILVLTGLIIINITFYSFIAIFSSRS